MFRFKSLTLLSILSLVPVLGFAAEELPGDALVVQAKIPKVSNWLEFGFDSAWSTSVTKLLRVNAADNSFVEIDIKGSGAFHAMGVGEGAIWVPDLDRSAILKVDPATNKVVLELPAEMLYQEGNVGAGEGAVWAVTGNQKTLTRYNSGSGAVEATIELPSVSSFVVVDFGSVWVTGAGGGELYRIDPQSNAIVSTVKLHKSPKFMCSGEGSLWVLNQGDGLVDRIDGESGKLLATIDSELRSGHGGDIACGGGYVWAKMSEFSGVPGAAAVQIDPKTNTVLRRFAVAKGFGPDIRYGAGSLWISGSSLYRIEAPK